MSFRLNVESFEQHGVNLVKFDIFFLIMDHEISEINGGGQITVFHGGLINQMMEANCSNQRWGEVPFFCERRTNFCMIDAG